MNELSKNQLHYLNMRRRHKRIVAVSRVSILLAFLFLWELPQIQDSSTPSSSAAPPGLPCVFWK